MRWQETQVTCDKRRCLYILQAGLRETAPQRSRPHSQPKCRSTPRPSCMVDATHLVVNSETPDHHHRPFHYSKRHTQWPERQHMRNATRATSRGCRARVVTKPDRQRNVLRDYFETRATRSTTPTEGTAGACPHVRGSWTRHVRHAPSRSRRELITGGDLVRHACDAHAWVGGCTSEHAGGPGGLA